LLRRSGHPEFEFAEGFCNSSFIKHDECFRLQIANASGEDLLPDGLQQVRAANPTMDQAGYPNINQLKVVLSKDTPLDLEVCKARTTKKGDPVLIPGTKEPVPDLCGNLSAVMRKEGMYLIETHWPGKRLGHLLLFDAERNYLMMGRCGETLKQTTLIPTADDCLNPMERLKDEYGFEFTVGDVALIMLNTKKMDQVPLAAYDLGPARERKAQKRKAYEDAQEAARDNNGVSLASPIPSKRPNLDQEADKCLASFDARIEEAVLAGPPYTVKAVMGRADKIMRQCGTLGLIGRVDELKKCFRMPNDMDVIDNHIQGIIDKVQPKKRALDTADCNMSKRSRN
jgi:hypothetical protein